MHLSAGAGSRIRTERERLGMTQEEFGKLAEVSRRTQAAYEADQNSPTVNYLAALDAAKVDVWYVLTGQPAPETALDRDEEAMLRLFRQLAPDDREAVARIIDALHHRQKILSESDSVHVTSSAS